MPTVFIVIQQNDNPGRNSGSRDDLVLNIPVVLTNSNDTGVFAWAWQFVDKPEGSVAALSTPSQSVSGFTPDIEGTYLIRLTINNGSLSAAAGAAIRTAHLGIRIPAASENDEFDPIRGWASAVDQAFRIVDDGYGNLASTTVNSATAPLEISGNNIDINPNNGKIGGGTGTGSLTWSDQGDAAVVSPDGYSLAVAFNGGAELFASDGVSADSFVEVQPTQVSIHTPQTNIGGSVEITGDGYFASSITMADNGADVSPVNEGRFRYNSTLQTFESSTNGGSYTRLGLETLQQAYDFGGGDIAVDTIQLLPGSAGSTGLVDDGLVTSFDLNAITGLDIGMSTVRYAVGDSQTAWRSVANGTWTAVSGLPNDIVNPNYNTIFLYAPNNIVIGTSHGNILTGTDLGGMFATQQGDNFTIPSFVTPPIPHAVKGLAGATLFMGEGVFIWTDDNNGNLYLYQPGFGISDMSAGFGFTPFANISGNPVEKVTGMVVFDTVAFATTSNNTVSTIWQSNDFVTYFQVSTTDFPSGTPILHGFTYTNGMYIAVGESGTILTSSKGISWAAQVSGTLATLNAVYGVDGDKIVVVGQMGTGSIMLTSTDGYAWTTLDSSVATAPLVSVFEDSATFETPGSLVIRTVGGPNAFRFDTIPPTGGHLTVTGSAIFEAGLDAYGHKITTLGQPIALTDATTKGYVDQIAAPLVINNFTAEFSTSEEHSIVDQMGTPEVPFAGPANYELGVRFTLSVPATALAISFLKDTHNTGTHIAHLWRVSGSVKLAEETFVSETSSGWQTVTLSTPVSLLADTQYIVSYSVEDNLTSSSSMPPLVAPFSSLAGFFNNFAGNMPDTPTSYYFWIDIVIDIGAHGPGPVEVGFTVSNPIFAAEYSRPVAFASLDDGSGPPFPVTLDLPATSFTFGEGPLDPKNYIRTTINDSQAWTLSAYDHVAFIGPTKTAMSSIVWTAFIYYGVQEQFIPLAEYITVGNFEGTISSWNPTTANGGTAVKASFILGPALSGIITNTDFETGDTTGWAVVSQGTGVAQATTDSPHSGIYCLKVGASGVDPFSNDVSISQNFTVPMSGGLLSFWVRTSSPDAINYDWFQGHIRNSAGSVVLLDLFAGLTGDHRAQPTGGTHSPPPGEIGPVYYPRLFGSPYDLPWTQVTADLTPYAGQTVKLFFLAEDDNFAPAPTILFIDDIVVYENLGAAHTGTYFGLVTADGTAGSEGKFTQTITLPGGSGAITFDGYYRASGSGALGPNYDTEILADSPFAYWKLDELFGSNAQDSSGHFRNASISGGWTFGLPGIINDGGTSMGDESGFFSPQVEFDGSIGIDWNTAWSFSYGARVFDDPFNAQLNLSIFLGTFSNFFGSLACYVDTFNNGSLVVGTINNAIITVDSALFAGDNHVVAVTCDGTNLNVYIDGLLVAGPVAHGQSPIGTWNVLRFGDATGFGLRGSFDNFALFAGTTLSSGRVAAQYAAAGGSSPQGIFIYDSTNTNILRTIYSANVNTDPGSWVPFTVDLSALAAQTIKIVIKVTTNGATGPRQLSVDDFSLLAGTNPTSYLSVLTASLQEGITVTPVAFDVSAPDGYFVAVLPTAYGAAYENFVDAETGLSIGMVLTSPAFTILNPYGVQIDYDFWRSEYPQLGQMVIKIVPLKEK